MIYLDNAATTYPKPQGVYAAVLRCMRDHGGNPGRGSHRLAVQAAECVYNCREKVAELFHMDDPSRVVFTLNTTYALNMAIKSIAHPGDHFLIGNFEHNSVLRPIEHMAQEGMIEYDVFDVRGGPESVILRLEKLVRVNTRAIVCAHASNICNITAPIEAIGEFCRHRGIAFIVDGAQSAGLYDIDLSRTCIDFLCAPGHKGLYGPQGCGIMVVGSRFENLHTLVEGGSGIHSLDDHMPEELPEHFEAGTLPTPSIAGLCEGISWVQKNGVRTIYEHECALWNRLYNDLQSIKGIRVYDDTPGAILLFNVKDRSPAYVGTELMRAGICVRSGFHCAPMAHKTLGSGVDGAVRVSFGAMDSLSDVKRCVDVLYGIACGK